MKISIVVAKGENGVIGKENGLPWHLPSDLRHFKKTTSGHHVIMGRKTYESLGKPLPGRTHIVVTRDSSYQMPKSHYVVNTLEEAFNIGKSLGLDKIFVLGGAEIYKISLPHSDEMVITEVKASPDGDTFFPEVDFNKWEEVSREQVLKDEKNEHAHDFVVYKRKKI
ncbi:dihydrofolate reductase [Pleomorphovibrio marinus]|uniref:dihydrofolate reductase n=1 Tax=Pleomorphovibrio marinus TaxID=2164132 RepID=UPI000E0AB3D9|nr:dihydrofolate reductase [Pleomorphovibrio marinus]